MNGWQSKLCDMFKQYIKETQGIEISYFALSHLFESREKVLSIQFQPEDILCDYRYAMYVRKELIPYINEDTVKGMIFQEKKEKFFDHFVEYFAVFKDGMFVLGDL